MTTPFSRITRIDRGQAPEEFGTTCQRVFPGDVADDTFGAMVCWLEPGARTAPDEHNQRELVIVQGGSGLIDSSGVVEQLNVGDVVLVERGHAHVVVAAEDGMQWISLYWPRVEPQA